jgi:hypothetical protein
MKFSIFPKAKPHPQGKDEKRVEAFKVSSPYLPQTVSAKNEEELIGYITNNAWSPFVFSGVRDAVNFVSTDMLVYDIDEGMTIDQLDQIIKDAGLCCLCLPSPSHAPGNERFRVIFPLAFTIRNPLVYSETWDAGNTLLKSVVDPSCKDLARFYFGSTASDGFWQEGRLFEPVMPKPTYKLPSFSRGSKKTAPVSSDMDEIVTWLYGEKRSVVPEVVAFFIKEGHTGLSGAWINTLNALCFSLTLSGVEADKIYELVEKIAPEPLDAKDKYQIERSIKDGEKVRKEEL